jgi:hypothetical protein
MTLVKKKTKRAPITGGGTVSYNPTRAQTSPVTPWFPGTPLIVQHVTVLTGPSGLPPQCAPIPWPPFDTCWVEENVVNAVTAVRDASSITLTVTGETGTTQLDVVMYSGGVICPITIVDPCRVLKVSWTTIKGTPTDFFNDVHISLSTDGSSPPTVLNPLTDMTFVPNGTRQSTVVAVVPVTSMLAFRLRFASAGHTLTDPDWVFGLRDMIIEPYPP